MKHVIFGLAAASLLATPALADNKGSSSHQQEQKGIQQIPQCTKKLGTVIDTMEKQIEVEKQKALEEARNLEKLKDNYRTRFSEFVMATVFLSTMLAKGRQELAALTGESTVPDTVPDTVVTVPPTNPPGQ